MPHIFLGIQVVLIALSATLIIGALYGMHSTVENISPEIVSRWPRSFGKDYWEKRRVSRLECNFMLELLEGNQMIGTGHLVNLSAKGACFASKIPFDTGDFILAHLPALRKGANKISGEVVWLKMTPRNTLYGVRLYPTTPA